MAVLPLLCDGLHGVAGWIPVFHDGKLHVVLSHKITTSLIEASVSTSDSGMEDVFKANMVTAIVDSRLFKLLMLKTPFNVWKKSARMNSSKWLKNNLDHYSVTDGEWFQGLIAEIYKRCDVPDKVSIDALEMGMRPKVHMFSDFSVTTHFKAGANVYENMGDEEELSREQLRIMPAMKYSWWTEAYQSGCEQYFRMEANDDGVLGVVSSGKYQAPYRKSNGKMERSYSYEDTLEELRKKRSKKPVAEPDVPSKTNRNKRKARPS